MQYRWIISHLQTPYLPLRMPESVFPCKGGKSLRSAIVQAAGIGSSDSTRAKSLVLPSKVRGALAASLPITWYVSSRQATATTATHECTTTIAEVGCPGYSEALAAAAHDSKQQASQACWWDGSCTFFRFLTCRGFAHFAP